MTDVGSGETRPARRARSGRQAVHILERDAAVRRASWLLLETAGYAPRVFVCGEDLLDELEQLAPGPVLIDIGAPPGEGLDVLNEVKRRRPTLPVIVTARKGDVASAVRAMKLGALDFLERPLDDQVLLDATAAAAGVLAQTSERSEALVSAMRRASGLSAREGEVLACLADGKSNKMIAYDLGLSIRTVEMHRARMMRRLGAKTLSEALQLARLAGLNGSYPGRSAGPRRGNRISPDR